MPTTLETPGIRNCKSDPVTFLAAGVISPKARRLLEHCLRQHGPTTVELESIRVDGVRSLAQRTRVVAHLRALTESLGIEPRVPWRSSAPTTPPPSLSSTSRR